MSCSSKHPCYICESKREDGKWDKDADLRTKESIVKNKNEWIESGAKKLKSKEHLNCVAMPLTFNSDDEDTTLLLLRSPSPSLHLKIGLNSTLKVLQSLWPGIDLFLKDLSISFAPYHGETLGRILKDLNKQLLKTEYFF